MIKFGAKCFSILLSLAIILVIRNILWRKQFFEFEKLKVNLEVLKAVVWMFCKINNCSKLFRGWWRDQSRILMFMLRHRTDNFKHLNNFLF